MKQFSYLSLAMALLISTTPIAYAEPIAPTSEKEAASTNTDSKLKKEEKSFSLMRLGWSGVKGCIGAGLGIGGILFTPPFIALAVNPELVLDQINRELAMQGNSFRYTPGSARGLCSVLALISSLAACGGIKLVIDSANEIQEELGNL